MKTNAVKRTTKIGAAHGADTIPNNNPKINAPTIPFVLGVAFAVDGMGMLNTSIK